MTLTLMKLAASSFLPVEDFGSPGVPEPEVEVIPLLGLLSAFLRRASFTDPLSEGLAFEREALG